ncbi:uncharacterized protein YutD [Scopulibacillus daqui]|uniref:Uncharacterized protein YutD n=1 Tax=Scopulibacillus daqui TaxID=1469162 RepID=A0ABS2Q1B7_9BACL|nr:YutD family protein [Scopulibacillus daqui]MBM7646094.1 uncharacterized protein YutD [Scopulibacillus daqui]
MSNPTVTIKMQSYELIENVKDGWNEEAFLSRYSDILSKYDYIVGDWGYEQLRLRGFYDDNHRKSAFDNKISMLTDYIYEYCNFGCAYFVLKKVKETP